MTLATMAARADRCSRGFHYTTQHPDLCKCHEHPTVDDQWPAFAAAIRQAARPDGTVHHCDVRPLIRGRFYHKSIGSLWRRAKGELLEPREVGHERSDDHEGKNAGRIEPYYRLRGAA